jgi:hypothetical protein
LTSPPMLLGVSYRGGRPRQRGGPKPAGQRSLDPHRIGGPPARDGRDCQHHKAVGSQECVVWSAQAKCRLKAVMFNQPKVLLAGTKR